MSSSIRLRWEHIVYHYFLMSLYVVLNSVYSIATDSSIYVGLNFLTDPVMATALSIFCGGPVWFGSAYVYILLQQYKDTHQMTLTTISAAETETMLVIIDDSD
jgi:formate/nitrite transporter FocA (FNT family)